jgi:hypothetical protein
MAAWVFFKGQHTFEKKIFSVTYLHKTKQEREE